MVKSSDRSHINREKLGEKEYFFERFPQKKLVYTQMMLQQHQLETTKPTKTTQPTNTNSTNTVSTKKRSPQ